MDFTKRSENLLKLYKALHPDDNSIEIDDLSIVSTMKHRKMCRLHFYITYQMPITNHHSDFTKDHEKELINMKVMLCFYNEYSLVGQIAFSW